MHANASALNEASPVTADHDQVSLLCRLCAYYTPHSLILSLSHNWVSGRISRFSTT